MLLAATSGAFDKVEVNKIKTAEATLLREFKNKHKKLLDTIDTGLEPEEKDRQTIVELANHVSESYKPMEKEA
jgi:F0F1-type ATP synthase alpha subunit